MSSVECSFDVDGVHCATSASAFLNKTVTLAPSDESFAATPQSNGACAEEQREHVRVQVGDEGSTRLLQSGTKKRVRRLNRIAQVRRQQGISTRSIARKLHLSTAEIHEQEQPMADLRISQLLDWHKALDVPLVDLLVEGESPLSDPISRRAHLLRVMKTAKAIQEKAVDKGILRLSAMLVEQLVGMMPELRDVAAWHSVGQRRTQDEMGRIAEQTIPDSFFCE